jgi:hypothetical protein
MPDDNLILLSSYAIKHIWDDNKPLRDNLISTMREARVNNGMYVLDEQLRFKTAIVVALTCAKGEDREWVEAELEKVKLLSGFIEASMLGLEPSLQALTSSVKNTRDYTLMSLWEESEKKT